MPRLSVSRDNYTVTLAVRDTGTGNTATLELTRRGMEALWPMMRAAAEGEDEGFEAEAELAGELQTGRVHKS